MKLNVSILGLAGGIALLCLGATSSSQAGLIGYWPANGHYEDALGGSSYRVTGEVPFVPARFHTGFSFDGNSSIEINDADKYKLTRSLTISAWIDCYSNPDLHPSEILFRGDDRGGHDPYFIMAYGDRLEASVEDADGYQALISAPLIFNQLTFVAVTLDDSSGVMRLYENGEIVSYETTDIRPFAQLDPNALPGLGIGNTQSTNYGEYFDGVIDELRLYDTSKPMPEPLGVTASATTIRGGNPVTLDVFFSDPPLQNLQVGVLSNNSAATVPAMIRLNYGTTDRKFTVTTSPVTATQTAKISVTVNGATASQTITITP